MSNETKAKQAILSTILLAQCLHKFKIELRKKKRVFLLAKKKTDRTQHLQNMLLRNARIKENTPCKELKEHNPIMN